MSPGMEHTLGRANRTTTPVREEPSRPRRKRWKVRLPGRNFAAQTLFLQLTVVFLVVVVTASVHGWLTYQRLGEGVEHRALSVARTVAAFSDVRAETAELTAANIAQVPHSRLIDGPLVPLAKDLRARTGALFVVITDDEGIRLTHPNPQELGKRVSTDPTAALNGREVTNQERGTLGLSARAKVPIYAPGSETNVVGEVSVGFAMQDILDNLRNDIVPVALTAVFALGIGILGSWLLGRRLRRLTLGLEPEEIVALAQDQEAVLRGVDEGVIGVSADGRITVLNAEAHSLLGLGAHEDLVGSLLDEAGLPASLPRLVHEATPESPSIEQVIDSRVLILSARAVRRKGHGQSLGTVIMLRDRTQMQSLTRQLQAVSAMTTALRAQRHEFANRLHTVSGLLGIGEHRQAEEYLGGILATGPLKFPMEQAEQLRDQYLRAFIGAKSVEAAERGVHLRIGPETFIRGRVAEAHDVTTVIGNLIDNAIHAAVHGSNAERWVEVEVLDELTAEGGTLHLVVADSGDGTEEAERIFTGDFTTASSTPLTTHGQGVGLPLCRQIARDRGGEVWLAESGSPGGPGAVFCARLPGTVEQRKAPSKKKNTGPNRAAITGQGSDGRMT